MRSICRFVLASLVLASPLVAQFERSADSVPLRNWLVAYGTLEQTEPDSPLIQPANHFIALAPCRIYDSRVVSGGPGPLVAATPRTIAIAGGPCMGIPTTAAGFSLNVTVTNSPAGGGYAFLTAYPTGTARPNASTVNFLAGAQVANAAIVPAGAGGAIDVYSTIQTEVIVDINGYFMPGVVTSVTPGTGLTGGGTGAVTLGIANGGVGTAELSAAGSTTGQVLSSNGSAVSWQPATLSLPYSGTYTSSGPAFAVTNTATGAGISGINSSNTNVGIGVNGYSPNGYGMHAESSSGTGLTAYSNSGTAIRVSTNSGTAIYAEGPVSVNNSYNAAQFPLAVVGCYATDYALGFGFLNGSGSGHGSGFSNRCFSMFVNYGIFSSGGEIDQASDRRAKEDITAISDADALRFLEGAKPVRFKWKNRDEYNYGFIAQDIAKLGFGEIVVAMPNPDMKETVDADGYVSAAGAELGLGYEQFTSILTKASQVLNDRIKALGRENAELRKQNAAIRAYLCDKDPGASFCAE